MSRLRPVSFNELVRKLRSFGYEGPFSGGKHLYMIRDDVRLTLPNLHRGTISVDLLTRILRLAGITREEWLRG